METATMLTWEPLYSKPVFVTAAIAIAALMVLAHRVAVSSKNRHWLLFVPRAVVFAILLGLLLNPIDTRETVMPPRPPAVAVLVDCSQSMGFGIGETRINGVRRTIGSVTSEVQKTSGIKLPLFRFGSHFAKVPGIAELAASDDASKLSDALQHLPSRVADDKPQAVVLFSDGAVTDENQFDELASAYQSMGIPVHAMLPGGQELLGDIAITALSVPQRVTKGDHAKLKVVVQSRGYEGKRVVVEVRSAENPQSMPVATLPITLTNGEVECELVVTADPEVGELLLNIPVEKGESVADNNRVPFKLMERERELNVIYMEGTGGREYKWLEDALHADSDIKCVSMVVNNQYAQRPTLQRIGDSFRGFPSTRAELFQYDVVICSDISFRAFTPEQIDWTVDLVSRRGGGFVMVGGHTSFGAGGWDRTPWEGLIPFDMSGRRDYLNQGFGVVVPEDAQSHPIWDFVDDDEKNRQILASMPAFSGTNLISRVKPAATLLGQTQSPLMRVGVMPVFACESFGRGRTFAMATDSTFSWGRRFEREWGQGDNRYFQKFWRNVVRWLAENSQASQRRLVVRTDQVIYNSDDTVELVAEAFDRELKPRTDYRMTAHFEAGGDRKGMPEPASSDMGTDSAKVSLKPNPTTKQYMASIPARLPKAMDDLSSPTQSAHLVIQAWDGDDLVATNSVELQLLRRSPEWLHPQARPEVLKRVADKGGGTLLNDGDELRALLSSFDAAPGETLIHKLPMWDRWPLWALLLMVLGLEWILRRRSFAAA